MLLELGKMIVETQKWKLVAARILQIIPVGRIDLIIELSVQPIEA
jgi:hypothetical protein